MSHPQSWYTMGLPHIYCRDPTRKKAQNDAPNRPVHAEPNAPPTNPLHLPLCGSSLLSA